MAKDGNQGDCDGDEGAGNQGDSGNELARRTAIGSVERDVHVIEPKARDQNTETEGEKIRKAVKRFAWVGAIVSGALAVATIVQAITSYYQLEAMNRGISQTDETLKLIRTDQRGWIAVEQLGLTLTGENPYVELIIKNLGRLPCAAQYVSYQIGLVEKGNPEQETHLKSEFEAWLRRPTAQQQVIVLAPNMSHPSRNLLDSAVNPRIKYIEDGTDRFIIIFRIEYILSDKSPAKTIACFEYSPITKLFGAYGGFDEME